ncbi:MotA/TolQ/ExbB proton channel family protein [Falsirhodobacter sp. alg1]|uniref:MotA/TolQ/ExbB proton channel family protein n=1 Tax=Falsirhodobacter sp. alg1 TaxID=1472418 RepID=UPI001EDBBAA8|nr:MotA/TolQ/ExbB proton channel family protein [Falsirhodobacter sp. alg1]
MIPEFLTINIPKIYAFLEMGGGAMWAIAVLSVLTLTVILWKIFQLAWLGTWSGGRATRRALALWAAGDRSGALNLLATRKSLRALVVRAAMQAAHDPALSNDAAQAETLRVARAQLSRAKTGLRALELFATIGPLLGLFGTVTGMIAAFQALQEAGVRADPATLAGGIWEALLTTAAGMAIAIPAQIALTWFEAISTRLQHEMEDGATLVFVPRPMDAPQTDGLKSAAG